MSLTILSVAYPFAPVSRDSAGGAEQVLASIDEWLVRSGHRSIVVASEGSRVKGTLVATPAVTGCIDAPARAAAWSAHAHAIANALDRFDIDVVHMHGLDFDRYVPSAAVPILATLHLPPGWYDQRVFTTHRQWMLLNCVSEAQRRLCPRSAAPIEIVPNGIDLESVAAESSRGDFVMALGRICPEKGFHIALDAARRAGASMILAGQVFPYPEHERYFREQIAPRLDARRRFIGPIGRGRKFDLLARARCVLMPSIAPETSSLVAMESIASGTPVIAFASGALPDLVEHGVTGFIVAGEREMADAIAAVSSISPDQCRARARRRFSTQRMFKHYLSLYRGVVRDARNGASEPSYERATNHAL